jgi:hypothetical protein
VSNMFSFLVSRGNKKLSEQSNSVGPSIKQGIFRIELVAGYASYYRPREEDA